MVRKVAIISDAWEVVWGDPFEAEALVLDPCGDDGSEDESDKVEIALCDREISERGRGESHGERGTSQ